MNPDNEPQVTKRMQSNRNTSLRRSWLTTGNEAKMNPDNEPQVTEADAKQQEHITAQVLAYYRQ